jgi:sugar/nucleoside kinase (ribokinase family)
MDNTMSQTSDNSKPADFVIAGNIVVDLFLAGMDKLPGAGGDEYTPNDVSLFPRAPVLTIGGNGGNTAYVLAGLGAAVSLVGATGGDPFGATARGWLRDRGVRLDALKTSALGTSLTVVATDTQLNRLTFHHIGANADFGLTDAPAEMLDNARVIMVNSYPTCPRLRDTGVLTRVFAHARAQGVATALDIGPDITTPLRIAEVASAMPHLDYLFCNGHELRVFTECADMNDGIAKVLASGVRCVVAKLGADGVRLADRDGQRDVAGYKVDAQFTVGAGDSFAAGFLYGVRVGWPLERSARFANAVAALTVSKPSGVLESPTLAEVEAFLIRTSS